MRIFKCYIQLSTLVRFKSLKSLFQDAGYRWQDKKAAASLRHVLGTFPICFIFRQRAEKTGPTLICAPLSPAEIATASLALSNKLKNTYTISTSITPTILPSSHHLPFIRAIPEVFHWCHYYPIHPCICHFPSWMLMQVPTDVSMAEKEPAIPGDKLQIWGEQTSNHKLWTLNPRFLP